MLMVEIWRLMVLAVGGLDCLALAVTVEHPVAEVAGPIMGPSGGSMVAVVAQTYQFKAAEVAVQVVGLVQ